MTLTGMRNDHAKIVRDSLVELDLTQLASVKIADPDNAQLSLSRTQADKRTGKADHIQPRTSQRSLAELQLAGNRARPRLLSKSIINYARSVRQAYSTFC
ncbi:hypothetical protein T4D_8521 [Trichinella pseudospiralis]|uniref:Uncharacterized protein n=1 Tax=Trichinella pseudospiralis TaxID=6337 RepID=A0A0V1F9C8_TRIPS|nr:hypothetical protein T4D_8521 [Trichinella pseudospiralis]